MGRRDRTKLKQQKILARPLRRRLAFERLEERRLLAITVNSLIDEADGSISDGDVSLRDAISLATSGETINFAASITADGPAKILLTRGQLVINKSLSIVGPGASRLTIDASGNDRTPNTNEGNGSRVFNVDDGVSGHSNVLIQGLSFAGGDTGYGGAIRSKEPLTVRESSFYQNAAFDGGAIGAAGPLFVFDSDFIGNRARKGGGIAGDVNSEIQITRCSFWENDVSNSGGAIYSERSLKITDSVVENNRSATYGGGISSFGSATYFRIAVVGNNSLSTGAGIYAVGTLTVRDSLVSGNRIIRSPVEGGNQFGGGIFSEANTRISNTTIANNYATRAGGGWFASGRSGSGAALEVILSNSTISGNETDGTGGGIHVGASILIQSSTIASNQANGQFGSAGPAGGGIRYSDFYFGRIELNHTIVANNLSNGMPNDLGKEPLSNLPSALYLNRSLVESLPNSIPPENISGPSIVGVDPKLSRLAGHGGIKLANEHVLLTHMLLPGGPAIDAGDPAAVAGANGVPEFDQRDAPWSRVVGGRIDIGAVESQANPLAGDYNFNDVVDAADYTVWRDTLGSTGDLRADGVGPFAFLPNGIVDVYDFAFWRANFGNVLSAGSGAVAVGNEPQATVTESTVGLAGVDTAADFTATSFESARPERLGNSRRVVLARDLPAHEMRADVLAASFARRRGQIFDEDAEAAVGPTQGRSEGGDEGEAAWDSVFALLGELGQR